MLNQDTRRAPDPDREIRTEFSNKLLARLNAKNAARQYEFIHPTNLEVVQVDQGQLTGHVYGLLINCKKGFDVREGLPAIGAFMSHLLSSMASALDDSGIAVYFKDSVIRGPDNRDYADRTFIVHNTVSNTNNPLAGRVFFNQQEVSGNQSTRLNLYQITLAMRGLNPGFIKNKASLFVDRLTYMPNVQEHQVATPQNLIRRVGDKSIEFLRYKAEPLV